jgi:hypothetical protein
MTRLSWSLTRLHDLPPSWDGQPVEWSGWEAYTTTAELHLPLDQLACKACGSLGREAVTIGVIAGLAQLSAFRCVDCRADVVWDRTADEWWDLEPADYLDQGSHDPRVTTPRLF